MDKIRLFSIAVCPFAQRTRILLRYKNVPHETTEFDLSQPMPDWFKEMNPEERVPVIEHKGRILNESSVINEYLEETHPQPAAFPTDPYKRALSRIWIAYCNDSFIPAMYTLLMSQDASEQNALKAEALDTFRQLNSWLEKHNPGGTWAFESFGMVDLSYAPFFQRYCLNEFYREFSLPDSADFKRVKTWIKALLSHELVRSTGMRAEKFIRYYHDYALGVGDGEVPAGREKSSFAMSESELDALMERHPRWKSWKGSALEAL